MAEVKSPMPSKVLEINVSVGDVVKANTTIVTVESMKMEMPLEAGVAGTVKELNGTVGETVPKDFILAIIE